MAMELLLSGRIDSLIQHLLVFLSFFLLWAPSFISGHFLSFFSIHTSLILSSP